ncbi:hypothetical protein BJ508DRAFT_324801 [Ascobolus immersus RN42]|uniref:Apple domain-containing protein n=1 Tax=Ascobolus immersus RN42 TaxID=1160509 RepID=A0A3N4IAW4_ASCIM|nr:hypothetical protein BJ508DRAFT_324801 [Ascobolus immersus RN42]
MTPFKSVILTFALLPALISAAIECPKDNGKSVTITRTKFTVQCGIDRVGNDLANMPVWVETAEKCAEACVTAGKTCLASVYNGSTGNAPCYLKGSLSLGVSNANHISLVKESSFDTCGPAGNLGSLITLSQDTTYGVTCNPDWVDGDATHNYSQLTANYKSCLQACEENAETAVKCRYVTFTPGKDTVAPGGRCQFHTTKKKGTRQPGSFFGERSSVCPDKDGDIIRPEGVNILTWFKVSCYKDRVGGNLEGVESTWTATAKECMSQCGKTSGCKGVSWHWGYPHGRCHFKGDTTIPFTADSEVYSGTLVLGGASVNPVSVEAPVADAPTVVEPDVETPTADTPVEVTE